MGDFIEDKAAVSPSDAIISLDLKEQTASLLKTLTPREGCDQGLLAAQIVGAVFIIATRGSDKGLDHGATWFRHGPEP